MILCKIWGNVNMRKKFWLPAVLIILILLTGCGNKTSSVNGVFRAVNPPEDTGETVIKELSFDKDKVTMISDDIRQTVDYNIKDGKFTIMTKKVGITKMKMKTINLEPTKKKKMIKMNMF